MNRLVLLLGYLAIILSSAQAGELFRWVDSSGKVHYGDMPPTNAQVQTKKFSDAAGSDEPLPYETRRAQQNFPVTLYTANNCTEACNQGRSLLNNRGIPFNEKALKTKEEFDAFKALSGINGTPALSIGKTYLGGFQAEKWHSELDIAGYPKTAPYRAPNMPPAASQVAPTNPSAQ